MRDARSLNHDSWIWTATHLITDANALAAHGWREHAAFYRSMEEAARALRCALFWAPDSPSTIALLDKIEDVLLFPPRVH